VSTNPNDLEAPSPNAAEQHPASEADFLTTADVATLLRCSEKTVRRRIAAGLIPARIEGGRLLIDPRDYYDYIRRLNRRFLKVRRQRLIKQVRKGRSRPRPKGKTTP
jgi:hypothetical protein